MGNCKPDVIFIDLTDSFVLTDQCELSDTVINVDTDDSLVIVDPKSPIQNVTRQTCSVTSSCRFPTVKFDLPGKTKTKTKSVSKRLSREVASPGKSIDLGDCPICLDKLGKNLLASTTCGHVFCIKCLKHSIKLNKRCPTCRTYLRGKSSYHPLYI